MPTLVLALLWLMIAGPAAAHGDEAHGAGLPWTFDPWVVVPLATLALAYGTGMAKLARRRRRPPLPARDVMFWTGLATLAGALLSPLHWLGEHLFSFHMVEHEIVMAVSAPLIVLARPMGTLMWGLPANVRRVAATYSASPPLRAIWRRATVSATATIVHGAAIWAWHVPALFDAAVTNLVLHRLQHATFFASALLFWWAIIWRTERGQAAWHLFATMVHTSLLGALMALTPRVLYIAQTRTALDWGLTPLEDQQLAGMIMWVPAGTVYAGAAMVMLALWIRGSTQGNARDARGF